MQTYLLDRCALTVLLREITLSMSHLGTALKRDADIQPFMTLPRALALLFSLAVASPVFAETFSSLPVGKPQQLATPDQVPEDLHKSEWASICAPRMNRVHFSSLDTINQSNFGSVRGISS